MVTYQDMMMFTALIVEIVGLVVMIMEYSDSKKKKSLLAYGT